MSRVLVIAPHPDDEAIGCGGTLHNHTVYGDTVRVVFLTSGEQGGHGKAPAVTAGLREAEARDSAAILGIKQVDFWRQADGNLRATRGLVRRLGALLSEWRPTTIYVTHDREMHSDHRAAARLCRRALAESPSQDVPLIRMFEVWTPIQSIDEIVDISDHMETKIAAIRAHRSQCDVMRLDEAAAALNRYRGEMHSWPGGDFAEVFELYTPKSDASSTV